MECLCLCLYFTCTKLRHYLLHVETRVVCKADIVKHMLSAPILKGRLGKWMYAQSKFDLRYQPAKVIKGQALADLITKRAAAPISTIGIIPWVLFFDGSVCDFGCGIGLKVVSPRGATYDFALRLREKRTNNQTEYEAICKGLELLLDAGAEVVEVFCDSKVVINHLTEDYNCASDLLYPYFVKCQNLMSMFRFITLYWIPREQNAEANKAAQLVFGYTVDENSTVEVLCNTAADWTADLLNYLRDPAQGQARG